MTCGAALFLAPARGGEAGFPLSSVFTSDDTGVTMPAWIAVQDAIGEFHFGCNGLVSYDGQHWRSAGIKAACYLRGLDLGADGRLWAGAAGELGWFDRMADGEWKFHSLRPQLPAEHADLGSVWYVYAEAEGAVFFTEDKILRWDGKSFQVWAMPGARRLPAFRAAGKIYVHHMPTGLYVMGPGGPEKIIPAAVFDGAVVLWMEPQGDGWLFATNKGLFTYREGQLQPFAPEASAFVRKQLLTCGLRLPDGRLALGTLNAGMILIRPDGSVDRILGRADGLPDTWVNSLFLDRAGGLWVTSRTRIFRLSLGSGSSFFGQAAGLAVNECVKIVRHNGEIVVGTENGLYVLSAKESRFQPLGEARDFVGDLRSTPAGLLYSRLGRVSLMAADGATKNILRPLRDAFVTEPSRLQPGTVFVSTDRTIVAVDAAGQSRVLVQGLPENANSIAEDAHGRLWLGTYSSGLFLAEPHSEGVVRAGPVDPSVSLPAIKGMITVLATRDGMVLVFTRAGGFILGRDSTRFEPITGYPARQIAGCSYLAADDSVWVFHTDYGDRAFVAKITLQGDHASWQPHTAEGLGKVGHPRSIFAETNEAHGTTLWIGGTGGLLRHEVPASLVAPAPAKPLLRALAGNMEESALRPIVGPLPFITKSLRFDFAVPEFSRRDALRMETFIEGIDHGWVKAEPTARRELTAVRDGRYTFRVRAVAETGVASEPAEFHFEILAPWWRTMPAIIGMVFALVPGAYGIFRLRVRALRRHNTELEEKVRQRTEQLARASAAKTEFVANMSHDIRNPLNGIVGLALALEDTRLDEKQSEIVATLRECTTYLSTLVDDVLDFASIEAGKVELRPGPFVPLELLRSVATTLRSEASVQGGVLLVETDPELPRTLLGDAGRIQQILVNYTGNALKYAGGTVRLTAKLAPDSVDEVEFSVTDDGPGVSDEEKSVLFTKFTRLTGAHREAIPGAGLGLASCRLLADLMGGSVGVESVLGLGSRFYLRLPLTVVTEPVIEAPSPPLPSATVLVVEDADYNAWAAAAVLAKLGLPHERARTGGEALAMMAAKRFDVVLLDRNLPDMDGTEVAKRIREQEADGPRAILLAVTAYCTAADRELCLAAGMDAFLGKPLTPHKLRRVLLAAGRRHLAAASMQVSPDALAGAVDVSLLQFLSDGSEQGLDEQIERFLATLSEADNQLSRACTVHDFTTLGSVAHHVLSQAKMIGGSALETAAAGLEQAARARDELAFGELMRRVHGEIQAVTAVLRRRRRARERV